MRRLVLLLVLALVILIRHKTNRKWLHGLWQTLLALAVTQRPASFSRAVSEGAEEVECNGERYMVWWGSKPVPSPQRSEPQRVWVLLPGGMTSGDTFYAWAAVSSGVFGDDHWAVFHNPGIVNKVQTGPPAALTDTTYIEHFVTEVLPGLGCRATLMGFSAGSMLTIAMAARADELDKQTRATTCRTLDCCVAIHGPDLIRAPFESFHRSWSRFDIPFAYSLYRTMVRSGCTRILPSDAGGGLHECWLPWLTGWNWMRSYTEKTFRQQWCEMEDESWSCVPALTSKISTPVLRVLSENDPIISYSECVDPNLFQNVDKVVIQPAAGHCSAFNYDAKLPRIINDWRNSKLVLV